MESFFSRYKNALVLIVVLLAQVIGVAIQVRRPLPKEHAQPDAGGIRLIRYWAISLVSPPERLVHWLGTSILGVWDNYLDLIHVRQQNKDLQSELQRIRIEEGGIVEDARQGQRLQQLLAFKQKYVYQTVPAQIIGTSGTEQSRILSINKGSKDGVGVDMPVITPEGVVGRIREVFPHTSQVLEITDPTSGAGVILATTRIRGILRGTALGQPQVVNVMPDERIKAGEQVVTSGGDQIFPRGLAVGVVDRVVTDPDHDPLVDVLIHPAANLAQLEEVLVITNMGDVITPKQKLDMMQSEAAADAEQLKASEILAERLPSRIDPDAPKTDDENSDDSADAQGEGIARPMRPPAALRPDRFTPNTTPAAASLTPGARLAPQSEGSGTTTASAAKPHATVPASVGSENPNVTETAAAVPKKKGPDLVPDDGSRPPSTMAAHPTTPSSTASASAREETTGAAPVHAPMVMMPASSTHGPATATGSTATSTTRPAVNGSTVNGSAINGSSASFNGGTAHTTSASNGAATQPHATTAAGGGVPAATKPAGNSSALNGTITHTNATAGNGSTASPGTAALHATNPRPAAASADNSAGGEVKTKVVVDGPLPSGAKKPQPSASTAPASHQTPSAQTQQTQHAPTAPAVQHKAPELVPDDGSRPPPTMLKPKPQTQPTAPAQTQPQGGRQG
ncbi:rod shape-determining protein MreC [Alloacidobacterium dinghuense]|uniref:Cell shape-determining protein MreC n=1 Tax=Alloacidobacterium dinghuense TaxID=2763107 RepID=A0A7G8BIW6_9BACT|nr:rod shape-determining protein MreC [Alloacidobacterium dinghuense]QNI32486.1 rod shape-determining protein MreC [Alloacidobacterium dinghuense]